MSGRITIIVAVLGRYAKIESFLLRVLRAARTAPMGLEFVFVFDGPQWGTLPSVQQARLEREKLTVEVLDCETTLPAVLFNRGMERSSGEHLLFCTPDSGWSEDVTARLAAAVEGIEHGEPAYIGSRQRLARYHYPHEPIPGLLYSCMLYCPIVPLSYFVVPRRLATELLFDTSPLLQQSSDWDFLLRLTRKTPCRFIGMDNEPDRASRPVMSNPLYTRPFAVGEDIVRRYIVRSKNHFPPHSAAAEICADPTFLDDLPVPVAEHLMRQHARFLGSEMDLGRTNSLEKLHKPLRITITGGVWEYHHNWLCFYNYLDNLQGTGFATYQVLFDTAVGERDLVGSDLVIISRGRSDNVAQIIAACKDAKIPVLYMIDDNWLSIAKDWPEEYGEMFSPGSPSFDNFIHAIRKCDAVLTYNSLMVTDLADYARKVVTLPTSVDLARFEAFPRPVQTRFVVGYTGSPRPRYVDAAFEALAEIGRRPDVDILLMGSVHESVERMLAGCRIIREPHQSYHQYINTLRGVGADILIAPLDNTRTSRSKCPNKYLEMTAAGAVGVYSAVEPYIWHVEDGVTGRLIEDTQDTAQWAEAIGSLLDRNVLARMHAAARNRIALSNDVPIVALQFRDLVAKLVAEGSSSGKVVPVRRVRSQMDPQAA
jgi:hypothetical protein